MKKIILLIIFIFLLNFNYNEKIVTTFKEDVNNSFYILEFPNNNITTNNFLNYFDNIQVIWVEVNSKYNVKKRYNYYNIDKLKKDYLEELENKGYHVRRLK